MTQEIPGWKPGDAMRILIYGLSKSGKTFGAGSFPRPCFMDFDRGIDTVFSPDFFKVYGYREIQYRAFYERSFKGPIVQAHNAYDDACKYFDEMMAPAKRGTFDTWVIDSGTTLSEDAQNKAVILLGSKEYGEMSQSHSQAMKHGMLVPRIQDYGAERSLVEQFVDMILSTDKNVVFICHEQEVKDKQGATIAITPLLTGKSREAVPLRFPEVYNLQAKKAGATYDKTTNVTETIWKRVCQTTPDGLHLVGSRNSVPNETLWDYTQIEKALRNSYEERMRQITAARTAADKAAALTPAKTPAA